MLYIAKLDWGYVQECADICQRMLHAAKLAKDPSEEAKWLHHWAVMNNRLGNYAAAEKNCNQGLEIVRRTGQKRLRASFLHRLGMVKQDQGDYNQARKLYKQSVRLKEEVRGRNSMAAVSTRSQYAKLLENEGNLEQALEIQRNSLEVVSQAGRYKFFEFTPFLARILRKQGNYSKAETMCVEAMKSVRKLDNRSFLAIILLEAGLAALSRKEYNKAKEFLYESEEVVAYLRDKVQVFLASGMLNHQTGNLADARRYYEGALVLDFPFTNYSCIVKLGLLCLEEGKKEEAHDYFARGIVLCNELLDKTPRLYDVLYHLALAQLGIRQSDEALTTYRKALEVCSAKGVVQSVLQDLQLLNRASQPITGLDEAIRLLEGALDSKSE